MSAKTTAVKFNPQHFRLRSEAVKVSCGTRVRVEPHDVANLLKQLKEGSCNYLETVQFNECVICEMPCVEGDFAVETVLCIPKRKSKNAKRLRLTQPRVACCDCAADYAATHQIQSRPTDRKPIGNVWQKGQPGSDENKNTSRRGRTENPNWRSRSGQADGGKRRGSFPLQPDGVQMSTLRADVLEFHPVKSKPNRAGTANSEGFLVCTQLVKTGGADRAGVQVGDVFIKLGRFTRKSFKGLKAIANLVRRSAQKEIDAVVIRKVDDHDTPAARTLGSMLQKVALKLTPLESHDADGGGVLGAVLNTWPLPTQAVPEN